VRANGRPTRRRRQKPGIDAATGTWNRAGFVAAARPVFVSCRRRSAPVALAYFDLDFDGTPPRDNDPQVAPVVAALARQLQGRFRETDVIGRIDTFRFAVLLADAEPDIVTAFEGRRELSDASTAPFGLTLVVTTTLGDAGNLEKLMREADSRANWLTPVH